MQELAAALRDRLEPGGQAVPPEATSVLVCDLNALRRNYRRLAALAPASETAAVVKADAYGLGAPEVVPALLREGCSSFFAATPTEAVRLREIAPDAAIYVLNGVFPGTAQIHLRHGLRPVLGSLAEIEAWAHAADGVPCALHIDTGMNRLGLDAGGVAALAAKPGLLARIRPALVMSHLACADEPAHPKSAEQRAQFIALAVLLPDAPLSLANSAGVFLGAPYHFGLTRPGIALYGGRARTQGGNPMEAVVALYGRVVQVHWAERGETVGYGAEHTLSRRTRIATVTTGYADGYARALSASDAREGAFAVFQGKRMPMLGRVSMDLTMFDATEAPEVERGGFLELIGEQMTVDDLAAHAGTIAYEVLTSIGRRTHRIFIGG